MEAAKLFNGLSLFGSMSSVRRLRRGFGDVTSQETLDGKQDSANIKNS